jgi:hypothetical protein
VFAFRWKTLGFWVSVLSIELNRVLQEDQGNVTPLKHVDEVLYKAVLIAAT